MLLIPDVYRYFLETYYQLESQMDSNQSLESYFSDLWTAAHDQQVLHDPFELKGMESFVSAFAKRQGDHIVIVPDYDADGITSGVLLAVGLSYFGFSHVDVLPPQVSWGFGFSEQTLQVINKKYDAVDVILTCDNGSNSSEAIRQAQAQGITCFITDHHEPSEGELPTPYHLNPHRDGDAYPFDGLSGAGVAFKFLCALGQTLDFPFDIDWFIPLVGISTVADMMPMLDENRYFVSRACALLSDAGFLANSRAYPKRVIARLFEAYQALVSADSDYEAGVTYQSFGFTFGPLLNTLRRLKGDPTLGFALFLDQSRSAVQIMQELVLLNDERKADVARAKKDFQRSLTAEDLDQRYVFVSESSRRGYAGLLANDLVRQLGRPCVVLSGDSDRLYGSGRAPEGFNLTDLQEALDEADWCYSFGGHAGACGLNIDRSGVDELNELMADAFDGQEAKVQASFDLTKAHEATGLSYDDLVFSILPIQEALAPFGQAFPEPLFRLDVDFRRCDCRRIGKRKQHLKVSIDQLDILYWNVPPLPKESVLTFLGKVSENVYLGQSKAQFIVDKVLPVSS